MVSDLLRLFSRRGAVLLVVAYAKNEMDDLSPADKKYIREMIKREHAVLSNRPVK
jgi:hypothetical protein